MTKEEFRFKYLEEMLDEIKSHADPSWRHGCYMKDIYKDPETNRYWEVSYKLSGDGEYHGICDNEFFLNEVFPVQKTVTITEYVDELND